MGQNGAEQRDNKFFRRERIASGAAGNTLAAQGRNIGVCDLNGGIAVVCQPAIVLAALPHEGDRQGQQGPEQIHVSGLHPLFQREQHGKYLVKNVRVAKHGKGPPLSQQGH